MSSERDKTTAWHYPDKVLVERFAEIVKGGTANFVINMNNLEVIPNELYPEQWMEIYAKWLDMRNFPRPLNEILGLEKDGEGSLPSSSSPEGAQE